MDAGSEPRMTLQTLKVLREMTANPTRRHYGLELVKAAGLPSGTIYPILARLEAAGWVSSDWEEVDPSRVKRPRRRFYLLTGTGRRRTREELVKAGMIPDPEPRPIPSRLRPQEG